MNEDKGTTLPYRTDSQQIVRFLESFNRHRNIERVSQIFGSSGALQGTIQATQVLGFVDSDVTQLTARGREYLLDTDQRGGIMLSAIMQYDPYGLLVEAALTGGSASKAETTMAWMTNWWAANGYGASANNQDEGATTLAKLLESATLGTFVVGRRGRPTRIEWSTDAQSRIRVGRERSESDDQQNTGDYREGWTDARAGHKQPKTEFAGGRTSMVPSSSGGVPRGQYFEVPVPLSRGVAFVRLPVGLTPRDKERLLRLLDVYLDTQIEAFEQVDEIPDDGMRAAAED